MRDEEDEPVQPAHLIKLSSSAGKSLVIGNGFPLLL